LLKIQEKSLSRLSKDQGFGEIAPSDKDVLAKMPTGFVSVSITRDELDKKSVIDLGFTSIENDSEDTGETLNLDDQTEMPKRSIYDRKSKTLEEERTSFSPALESVKDFQMNRHIYTPSASPIKKERNSDIFFGNQQNFNDGNSNPLDFRGEANNENKKIMFTIKSKPSEIVNFGSLFDHRKTWDCCQGENLSLQISD
jgi:hypothetical protein